MDMPIQPAKKLNQFFTPDWLAKSCIEYTIRHLSKSIDPVRSNCSIDDYYWIDPSAGEGAFYNQLPSARRLGIEIDTRFQHSTNYVIKQPNGFLSIDNTELEPIQHIPTFHRIVIGNPPFTQRQTQMNADGSTHIIGGRINLAAQFIQRACLLADTVAFILGKNARRPSFQKHVPKHFKLVFERDLPDVEYNVPLQFANNTNNNQHVKTKHIHTVFQIYQRQTLSSDISTTLYPSINSQNTSWANYMKSSTSFHTSSMTIRQGVWTDGDWDIVFPSDPKSNIMIKRWATNQIGEVCIDAVKIAQERKNACVKEKLYHASNHPKYKRKRLGRTDTTYFFLYSKIPKIVADRFRRRKQLFMQLRHMSTTNCYSCNQQQLLDIYLA